ncbi:MAG: right-handed parallel beta-helix repeat-containing protein [Carboxylicivirga sp.]|nr:right-handed parallel beta-helix repeat-containing protein [Carboxylicivirga sp.]
MKSVMHLFLAIVLVFSACTSETVNPDTEKPVDPEVPVDNGPSTPCDFNFQSTKANDTLRIECSHNLNGQTIMLPENVVINYKGGEIINGELNFKESGIIDGRLLNHKFDVSGKVQLSTSSFDFEKNKWAITEGEVSDNIALENRNMLQKAIDITKKLGAKTFNVDKIDAYFLITPERHGLDMNVSSIKMPSDFNFSMSENTHLRVQGNNHYQYIFFNVRESNNVKIMGGHLYGDRDYHDYTPVNINGRSYPTHEWGLLIDIASSENVTIQNVNLSHASGDGVNIHSTRHTFDPLYVPSSNININNCYFDSNRRNNISITDGNNIIVENNIITNAGIDTPYSKGTAPRFGLDVEAHYVLDENNEIKYYQRARDITIRNNEERGCIGGAFIVAIGEDVLIESNTTEGTIAFTEASNVKIHKNTINAGSTKMTGIIGEGFGNRRTFGNEISSNIIRSQNQGIYLKTQDVSLFENTIEDCGMGISVNFNLHSSEIYDNNIINTTKGSGMIFSDGASSDVIVNNNNINVTGRAITFININTESEDQNNTVRVHSNELNGGSLFIDNSFGIKVE